MQRRNDEIKGWRPATPPKDYVDDWKILDRQEKRQDTYREVIEWSVAIAAGILLGWLFSHLMGWL